MPADGICRNAVSEDFLTDNSCMLSSVDVAQTKAAEYTVKTHLE